MKKKQFAEMFKKAIAERARYIGVAVQTGGGGYSEIIINPTENFEEKLKNYRAAYDEDMQLVATKGKKDIRIIAIAWGDSFADIEFLMTVDRPDWKKTIADAIDKVVNRMLENNPDVTPEQRDSWGIVVEGYKEQFYSNRYSVSQQRFIVKNAALYEDVFEACMNGCGEEFKKKFLQLSKELNAHA